MDSQNAERIVDSLKSRSYPVFPIGDNVYVEMFNYLNRVDPDGVIIHLGSDSFYIPETDGSSERFQYISFRRLIDNSGVEHRFPGVKQYFCDFLAEMFGVYSSDAHVRDIVSHGDLVSAMKRSDSSHSLLAKIEIMDTTTGTDKIKTLPLLVIPGQEGIGVNWESYLRKGPEYNPELEILMELHNPSHLI